MIEVEAKIKILNPGEYRERASEIGRFIGKEKKIDEYYAFDYSGGYPRRSIRIRKHDGRYEFNFKEKLSYVRGIYAKAEHELAIPSEKQFRVMLKNSGFKRWLRKEKTSEVYEINKNFHIEINNVKRLGWFLEIEYLTNESGIGKARREILKVIKKLGADKNKIIKDGYSKMLWKRSV
ncbi:MAG: class IV adenylate cyclase [Nanoarchaeota archaeon]